MANVKISELPSLSTMTDAGEIPVVAGGATKQITGANLKPYFTANVGFTGNTMYDLNGLNVNNSDLSHGFTAGVTVPDNGNTASPLQLTNTYGNITIGTGPSGTVTDTWTFDKNGVLGLPSGANIADGNLNGGSASATVALNAFSPDGNTVSIQAQGNSSSAVISVFANAGPTTNTWSFDTAGTITLPNGANIRTVDELTIINSTTTANGVIGINAREQSTGDSVAQVYLDGTDRVVRVSTYNPNTEIGYDWTFDAGGSFTLPTSPGNVYFGTNTNGPLIIADSLGITLNANRADTTQDYITVSQDGVNIFSVNTINIENNTTGLNNSDININSGDDIFLRGRNKVDDDEAEGGDINIWAGQGSNATSGANDPFGGGDIQIQGGLGGSGTGAGANGSTGGFVSIVAGQGGTSVDSNVGSGGDIEIAAGSAPSAVDTAHGGFGGGVSITAGDTTRINESGGSITLNTGSASGDGTGAAGYVSISIPSSNIGPGGSWYFTGTGRTLEVPANSEIFGPNFGNFTVGCAGNTIVTSSDYGANVKNWVFGYTGTLTLPTGEPNINTPDQTGIVTFNVAGTGNVTESTQIQFGSDGNTDQFIYMSTQNGTGNAATIAMGAYSGQAPYTTIRTYDGISVTNNWTFTHAAIDPTEAYLYVPGGAAITTPNATGGGAGKNIFIEAGAADQSDFYTTAGGELFLKGGRGASNDGGGGGHGGNVNINAGESADPAGVAGNVYITAGALQNWTFDNTGNLTAPNNISTDGNITANIIGASTQLQGKYIVLDTISFTNLPSPTFGARAFINDANRAAAGNFGAQVSGGGSNTTPIWSDGTNWYIG